MARRLRGLPVKGRSRRFATPVPGARPVPPRPVRQRARLLVRSRAGDFQQVPPSTVAPAQPGAVVRPRSRRRPLPPLVVRPSQFAVVPPQAPPPPPAVWPPSCRVSRRTLTSFRSRRGQIPFVPVIPPPPVFVYRLVAPRVKDRQVLRGSLAITIWREVTVFGDENGLFTTDLGSPSPGSDSYGAIPFNAKYVWLGGHENVTDDPAIKELWLAYGFEVEDIEL